MWHITFLLIGKFLVHYGWLDEEHQCYDSVRAIKYANPYLFSYSLGYLTSYYELNNSQSHTALGDVMVLFEVLTKANPSKWIPLYKVKPKQLNNIVETVARIDGESTIFKEKTIVFTGASSFPRVLMKEIASKCGAKVTGSVSVKTDYLICGENPGSKLEKAVSLEVEVKTDVWFLDAVSGEIDLNSGTIERTRLPLESNVEIQLNYPYQKLEEFEGKLINIACLPRRIQGVVESILLKYMEIRGVNKGSNGYKVDIIIHLDDGDYVLLEKAKQLNIRTFPLSKFNSMILENDS